MKGAACAIYHRVSTLDQNVKLARHEIRGAAKARGLSILLDIEEHGSGARNDRPGLQKVLAAADRGQIKAVIVWKLDRWGRSALDLLQNVKRLRDAGVRFVAVSQGIDIGPGADAIGSLILQVLAGVAEFERELIRERTKLALERVRRKGGQLGRPRTFGEDLPLAVKGLRDKGQSWKATAAELGITVAKARRAFEA